MARSKPVVATGPLGATAGAASTEPGFAKPPLATGAEDPEPVWADGFAKPPLVCGDAAAGGGETVGDSAPGLVKPPLDGELGEWGKVTRPHSEPLLWLDMNRP
jgi:hypothetical protein